MAYPTGISWTIISQTVGFQPINDTSTTQNHPIGTTCKAKDATLGEAEFIYLKGVASTAKGDAVAFDLKDNTTIRTVDDTTLGPIAVAMSANVASQYGWYCVRGDVPVAAGTIAAKDTAVYTVATAGTLDDTAGNDLVTGCTWGSVDTAGFAYITLMYPQVQELTST